MRTVKLYLIIFASILLCFNFLSCSDNKLEPEVNNNGVVVKGKKLVEVKIVDNYYGEEYDESYYKCSYDENGRLNHIQGSYLNSEGMNVTLIWSNNGDILERHIYYDDNDVIDCNMTIVNGLVEKLVEDFTYVYKYSTSKQLQNILYDNDGVVTLSWSGDYILKINYHSAYSSYEQIMSYSNISCKGYLPGVLEMFTGDFHSFLSISHPELFGVRINKLPSEVTKTYIDGDKVVYNLSYTFTNDEYIESCTILDNQRNRTVWSFKWE